MANQKADKTQPFHKISPGKGDFSVVNMLVEIPKGSRIKYEYDKEYGIVKVDRYLYQETPFFYDYGLVPQTWMAGDDDPLDIILLTNTPGFPGTLVEARIIGVVMVDDSGEQDDKIIAVPVEDPRWNKVQTMDDIEEHMRKEIKFFLENYAALQPKKVIKITGWEGKEKAIEIVKESVEEYKRKFG